MTDLVDRLRIEAKATYPEGKYLCPLMWEAADEIERLRKEIERLAVDRAWLKSVEVVDTAAADEIERLRAQVVSLQSSLDAGPPRPGKKTPNALEKPE